MRAYKCDRCGQLFENKNLKGIKFHITTDLCSTGGGLDLCNDCSKELQKWMKTGVKIEADKEDKE